MNYGGGLLVFDSTFSIKKMIYMFNKDSKTPVFNSLRIEPNMVNNSVNTLLKSNAKPYNSVKIVEEIKQNFL
jgi:hypothetical protein